MSYADVMYRLLSEDPLVVAKHPNAQTFHRGDHHIYPSPKHWLRATEAMQLGMRYCSVCLAADERDYDDTPKETEIMETDNERVLLQSRIDGLLRQVDVATEQLRAIDERPEDEYELGTVVVWTRQFDEGGQLYCYAAIKFTRNEVYPARWAITGRSTQSFTWGELWDRYLRHAIPGTLAWCSETTEIPT